MGEFIEFVPHARQRRQKLYVPINDRFRRIGLPMAVYDFMKQKFKKDFEHVTFYLNPNNPRVFGMSPSDPGRPNCQRILKSNKSAYISAGPLLNTVDWSAKGTKKTVRVGVEWNEVDQLILVLLDHPIE